MIQKIIRIFLVFGTVFIKSYNLSSQALINSTGNTLQNSSVNIEYSIGEITVTTLENTSNFITQGLLQPLTLQFKDCNLLRFIPNAFTPNGDNLNDCFGVKNWPANSVFELNVFNRWGQLVFKTTNILECWNGEYKGQPQPMGGYVYYLKANNAVCGPVSSKGTILLIR